MKLYLSSFRTGERFDELVAALAPGAKVAVVSNAVDLIPIEDRLSYSRNVHDPLAVFQEAGFEAADLDLRRYFGAPGELEAALTGVGLVWAVGGNSFLLRKAMRLSGFDNVAVERVRAGQLIYGGWSAGAVVAGPSLKGIELMDDPEVTAAGYSGSPVWEGLRLLDYAVVPHFRSEHAEADAAERAAFHLMEAGMPFRTLRDGEVLIV